MLTYLNCSKKIEIFIKLMPLFIFSSTGLASQPSEIGALQICYLEQMENSGGNTTVDAIKENCGVGEITPTINEQEILPALSGSPRSDSLLLQRIFREDAVLSDSVQLLPHKRNYVLPASYSTNPNRTPYAIAYGDAVHDDTLDKTEVKFQISLKFPIASELFLPQDQISFGFTSLSFWQAYNSEISAPFRETNYEPEVFYAAPLNWRPLNVDSTLFSIGFAHQSNGQGGSLSRSWNRINTDFVWEKGDFVFGLRSWWRISEDKKLDSASLSQTDNPDLEEFIGRFEFNTIYRTNSHELGVVLRQSFDSSSKNYLQIDWTFPLWGKIRGYAQYVNGYGESLIDYNENIERFSIGFLLSDLL